jgi:fido (protein-threonine AMPylation protein)
MRNLDKNIAGKIREVPVYIGGEERNQSKEDILISLNDWLKGCYHTEEDIRQLHIWFEKIHPFVDGNGRVGRILLNIQRRRRTKKLL